MYSNLFSVRSWCFHYHHFALYCKNVSEFCKWEPKAKSKCKKLSQTI